MSKLLLVINGKDKGKTFTLPDSGTFSIGRGTNTDTHLTDVRVSRNHCELRIDGEQLLVVDAGGNAGTFVNNQRINGEQSVQAGDVIRIGDTEMRLDDEDIALQATMAGISPLDVQTLQRAPAAVTGGPLTELVGSNVGHYQLTALLARGVSSMVFRGSDVTEGRSVAVKVLQPTASKSDGEMQRLARTLKPLTAVRHENLVRLYDVGKDRGYCWFAMELIEGESLSQVLQRVGLAGMLNWDHALRIGLHIAKGLAALHGQRILHRNITPRTVLINNSDKQAKLGGMWLARAMDSTETEAATRPTDMLRDLAFLPPEQMHSDARRDERSDLYSLGATLYCMITGRPPFEGKSIPEAITQVLQKQPARPRDFQLSLPPAFENLVLQLLAKKPDDRYDSADEVVEELERIARDPSGSVAGSRRNGLPVPPPDSDGVIAVVCSHPGCGQRLQARKKFAGTQVRCPTCGTMLLVPGQPTSPAQVVLQPAPVAAPPRLAPPGWNASMAKVPTPPAGRSPWPRAVAAGLGGLVVIGALVWLSGILGPKETSPSNRTEPLSSEKSPVK